MSDELGRVDGQARGELDEFGENIFEGDRAKVKVPSLETRYTSVNTYSLHINIKLLIKV